ncbi:MAG: Hsp33 family molecular chaperone HslO, partial [Kiritimatiellae bacterium]|nr:Hsp33 family molecular chaperone HslO [Kiritimatiellia bacterium]
VALSPSMLAGVASARTILKKIGLPHAVLRKTAQIKFACRCSPQRAAAMLAAIPENERASLPDTLDITCHFCGTTYSVPVRGGE